MLRQSGVGSRFVTLYPRHPLPRTLHKLLVSHVPYSSSFNARVYLLNGFDGVCSAGSALLPTHYANDHFFRATVKSRGLLRFLQAHAIAQLSLACLSLLFLPLYLFWLKRVAHEQSTTMAFITGVCDGHSLVMFIYIGNADDHTTAGTLSVISFFIKSLIRPRPLLCVSAEGKFPFLG